MVSCFHMWGPALWKLVERGGLRRSFDFCTVRGWNESPTLHILCFLYSRRHSRPHGFSMDSFIFKEFAIFLMS